MHTPKPIILAALALATIAMAIALLAGSSDATDVDQDITVDTVWDSSGSPYMIKASITVQDGAVLRIAPGTEVSFAGLFSLSCSGSGRIEATGLATSRITITSGKTSPAIGDWDTLESGMNGVFSNCSISYGSVGMQLDTNARATDCNFTYDVTGILIAGPNAEVADCEISGAGSGTTTTIGIAFDNALNSHVRRTKVWTCSQGINLLAGTASCSVTASSVMQCIDHGIGVQATGAGNRISDCLVDTTRKGLRILDVAGQSEQGGLTVSNCKIIRCNQIGIEVLQLSPAFRNVVQRCTVRDCSKGIHIVGSNSTDVTESTVKECGVGVHVENCQGYTIYIWKNNIIGSTSLGVSTNSQSYWDKDFKGNFWDNDPSDPAPVSFLKDTSVPPDGVSEIKYALTGLQADNYPLMQPVDYDRPLADAGSAVKVRQHKQFTLDGSLSDDNTYITNYTWSIDLPGGEDLLYGKKPSGVVDVAGLFKVTLTTTDVAGLTDTDETMLNVTDADTPVFEVLDIPTTIGNGRTLNVSATITDNINVTQVWLMYRFGTEGSQHRLDLVAQGDGVWSGDISVALDQTMNLYLQISARDRENNIARSTDLVIAVVDDLPPTIEPDLPDEVTTGDRTWFNCTATDNRGVQLVRLEYTFPGQETIVVNMSVLGSKWFIELQVPSGATSPLGVVFNATDRASNVRTTPVIEITVRDNDKPVVNYDLTDPRIHYGAGHVFRVRIGDNIGVTEAFVDLKYSIGDWTPNRLTREVDIYTGVVEVAADRGHLLWYRFRARDAAGNELETPEVQIELLSQNPVITTQPVLEAFEGRAFALDMNATDPDNMPYELQWIMFANGSWLSIDPQTGIIAGTPTNRDIGTFSLNVTVQDGEGGEDSIEFIITVNPVDTPPVVTITFPENEKQVGSILRVTGRVEDDENAIVWVRARVDGGEWLNVTGMAVWSFEMPTKGFTEGVHDFEIRAYDGVSESTIISLTFIVPEKEEPDDGPGLGAAAALVALGLLALAVGGRRAR